MSGAASNYWAMSEYDNHLGLAYELANDFGEPTIQLDELIEILLTETPENITESLLNMFSNDRTLFSIFGPVVESKAHQTSWIAKK